VEEPQPILIEVDSFEFLRIQGDTHTRFDLATLGCVSEGNYNSSISCGFTMEAS